MTRIRLVRMTMFALGAIAVLAGCSSGGGMPMVEQADEAALPSVVGTWVAQ